ncbi:MAG: AMP-binding protein [Thermodesulfobacteriota bacterium]
MELDITSLVNRRADHRWDRIALGDMFERMTWSCPDREALIAWEGAYANPQNARLTYQQLDKKANQFANALRDRKLKRGDRVLYFSSNSAEHYIAQIGAAKAGVVMVPVNVMIAPDVIDHIIRQTEPKFSMVDDQLFLRAEEAFKTNGLKVGVTIPIAGSVIPGSLSFDQFIQDQPEKEPEVKIHGDDIVEILYTSGTTSWPKGVLISHLYLYFCAISHALSMSRGAGVASEWDYRIGIWYPIFHISAQGMTLSAHVIGGTAVMDRSPDARRMVDMMTREKLTSIYGGPIDYSRMVKIYEENPGQYATEYLRTCPYGWGPLPPEVDRKLRKIFREDLIILSYDGMTECVYDTRGWHHKFYETYEKSSPSLNYLGVSHPFYATRIVDEGMKTCPPGRTGEKVMRSPVMMSGYYKNEEATRTVLRGGWLHSGDACQYDENSHIILVDRFKDVIKSGGENVPSMRVENTILLHPKVENAAVFGVPHSRWGEAVVAAVIVKTGEVLDEKELIDFCRSKLAGFETPKGVVFVDQLPVSVGTKIKKYELRERYMDLFREEADSAQK